MRLPHERILMWFMVTLLQIPLLVYGDSSWVYSILFSTVMLLISILTKMYRQY